MLPVSRAHLPICPEILTWEALPAAGPDVDHRSPRAAWPCGNRSVVLRRNARRPSTTVL